MAKRILAIVGHDSLEYNRIKLFKSLGYEVLTTGVYSTPEKTYKERPYLPKADLNISDDIKEEYFRLNPGGYVYGKNRLNLSKEFLDKFDAVAISWIIQPYIDYFNILKDKVVTYESLGQSDGGRERALQQLRNRGNLKLIRISQAERNFPLYAGDDAIIDLEIDGDYFNNWNGKEEYALTINSAASSRVRECNWPIYLQVMQGLPHRLYGTGNENLMKESYCYGTVSRDELLKKYQEARMFFSLGTKPCPIVLSIKEAFAVGTPVITWGPRLGGGATYSAYSFIENGVNGFYSDNVVELKGYCKLLLNDYDLAKKMSIASRKTGLKHFDFKVIQPKWAALFNSLGV